MGWNHQPVLIFYSNLQAGVKEGHSLSLRFRIELWELSLVFLKQEKGKLTFSGICSCEIWDFLGIGFNDFIYFSPPKIGVKLNQPNLTFFFVFFGMGWWVVQNNISKPCSQLVSPKKKHDPLKLHQELPPQSCTLKITPSTNAVSQVPMVQMNVVSEGPNFPMTQAFDSQCFFMVVVDGVVVYYQSTSWYGKCIFIMHYIYICSLLYDRYRMTYEVYYLYSISMCLKHLKTILVGLLTVSISRAIGMIWCQCPSQTLALESTFNFLWICVDAIGSMLRTRVSSIDIWCKNFKISSTY